MTKETNTNQSANNVVEMDISDELQQIITDNMFWLKRRSKVRQADLAKSLGISQPTLSQKYSRTIAWTINDLAKAAVFFKVPVSYLVTNNFIEPSSEYQLNQNGSVDISRHEAAAPAGARYLRKPDDDESRPHGAIGPRAFVMPLMDVDQMSMGPRFSARTRFGLPHLDSNQDKGFQRPVCCHYTMGERHKSPRAFRQVSIMPYTTNRACRGIGYVPRQHFRLRCGLDRKRKGSKNKNGLRTRRNPYDRQAHRRKPKASGEQEALPVMLRIRVEQFRDGTVLEHRADGTGQQRRDG